MNGSPMDQIIDTLAIALASKLRSEIAAAPTSQITRRLLTVEQAAVYLGRSKAAVQHMIQARTLPFVRFDRRVFLDVRELDKWIDQHREG